MYLGSDALALAPLTDRIQYLEEGDIALLGPGGATLIDGTGEAVERPIRQTAFSGAMIGKGNHRHFMEKEIHEQPAAIGETLRSFADPRDHRIALPDLPFDLATVPRVSLIACGTASFACMVAKYWFERFAGLPVDWDIGSEFRYREAPLVPGQVGIFVSQSGETADTLAALRHVKGQGHKTLAIVNVPESTLAREADGVLRTLAGPEIGVASTKAFTTQLATLACLALGTARARGRLTPEAEAALTQALDEVPARAHQVLEADAQIRDIATTLAQARDVLYLGRGPMYPIALEGALKLKEISYIHAEGYAAGELKHGPIALIDDSVPVIVVAPRDAWFDKTASNLQEVVARGGKVVLLSDRRGVEELARLLLAYRDPARLRPLRRPHPLQPADPAAGLSHSRAEGHRRRPAAQLGEVGDGRVGNPAGAGAAARPQSRSQTSRPARRCDRRPGHRPGSRSWPAAGAGG